MKKLTDVQKLYEKFLEISIQEGVKLGKTERVEYLRKYRRLSLWDRLQIKSAGKKLNFIELLKLKGVDPTEFVEVRWVNKRPMLYLKGVKHHRSEPEGYDL